MMKERLQMKVVTWLMRIRLNIKHWMYHFVLDESTKVNGFQLAKGNNVEEEPDGALVLISIIDCDNWSTRFGSDRKRPFGKVYFIICFKSMVPLRTCQCSHKLEIMDQKLDTLAEWSSVLIYGSSYLNKTWNLFMARWSRNLNIQLIGKYQTFTGKNKKSIHWTNILVDDGFGHYNECLGYWSLQ